MLVLLQISSYATGYDGSMMNGLQSLTIWQNSFNNPGASELGLYVTIKLNMHTLAGIRRLVRKNQN